jgi:hypothetical protein
MKKETKLVPLKFMSKAQEPFMPVDKGFGYYGLLMETEDRELVQCHECGELFSRLPAHLKSAHGISTREYKEKYELNYETALQASFISEKQSIGGEFRYKLLHGKLNNSEIKAYALKQAEIYRKNKMKRKKFRHTIEMMNKFGTCPAQIEERFTKLVDRYGRALSYTEMIQEDRSLLAALVKRYRSYTNTLVYFGLKGKAQKGHFKWNRKKIQFALKQFVKEKRRLPNARDTKKEALPDYMTIVKYFDNNWYKAKQFAFDYLRKIDEPASNAYDDNLNRISLGYKIT